MSVQVTNYATQPVVTRESIHLPFTAYAWAQNWLSTELHPFYYTCMSKHASVSICAKCSETELVEAAAPSRLTVLTARRSDVSHPPLSPDRPATWTNGNSQLFLFRSCNQRFEQEIDRSTIVVVCQPTPLPKFGRSCVRLWGYLLIIPHGQPKLGISWRVVGWIFFK